MNMVKIVTFVPLTHADVVRDAIGKAGGGKIGNYTFCSFSSIGTGRFKAGQGAHPAIGSVGEIESVEEERIEFLCNKEDVTKIAAAIRSAHPYEEVPIDAYSMEML